MMSDTPLATAMLARADQDGLPESHPLRVAAIAFEEAAHAYAQGTLAVPSFLGTWARAEKAWATYTGEPLMGTL